MTGKRKRELLEKINKNIADLNGIKYRSNDCYGLFQDDNIETSNLFSELKKREAAGCSILIDIESLIDLEYLTGVINDEEMVDEDMDDEDMDDEEMDDEEMDDEDMDDEDMDDEETRNEEDKESTAEETKDERKENEEVPIDWENCPELEFEIIRLDDYYKRESKKKKFEK